MGTEPMEMKQVVEYVTPSAEIGTLLIELTEEKVTRVSISGNGGKRPEPGCSLPMAGAGGEVVKWLDKYFEGLQRPATLPAALLSLSGTEFELKVWRALMEIPFGEVRTYGEVAESIGSAKAARAVGTACGKNRLPVLVPCHRVVPGQRQGEVAGTRGLGGYSAGKGVATKMALLRLEGVIVGG